MRVWSSVSSMKPVYERRTREARARRKPAEFGSAGVVANQHGFGERVVELELFARGVPLDAAARERSRRLEARQSGFDYAATRQHQGLSRGVSLAGDADAAHALA